MTGRAFSGLPGSLIVRVMGQGDMKGIAERLQGEAKAQEDSKESPLNLFLYLLSHCLEPPVQPVIHTAIIASPVLFAANMEPGALGWPCQESISGFDGRFYCKRVCGPQLIPVGLWSAGLGNVPGRVRADSLSAGSHSRSRRGSGPFRIRQSPEGGWLRFQGKELQGW